ncbi:MAG: two-component sensor histidine kinase [uncultured bacterium]|nr:MAG: two-component sensor histidine kinase [uncultured bacterium]
MEDENITSSRVKQLVKGANVDPLDIIRQVKIIGSVVKKAKSLEIAVLIPIIVRDKVIGIFIIGPKMSGDSFTDADLKTLEIISGQTASAIEQARLYEDDQTKSEFVSIASHELLTPTTAIEGYLSMILDEHMANVDETARKYLERVQTSAHRLSNLVKDLLSVSRLEAGRIKVKIEPVQVEPLIENVVSDLLPTTQEKRLSLTFLKPDETLPLCLADPDKLTQIIINMVGNAIKYTPEGSVLVLAESVDDKIKITVEDTGVGIKQEDLPHLFEKFYRVDNTETVGIVGSGLGLYISKSMVELMDGTIDVESTEWHGSRFIVTLPAVADSEEEQIVESKK